MLEHAGMRTTLAIDDDVLDAARELAKSRGSSIGQVLSDLARRALTPKRAPAVRNGVPLMPRRPPGSPRPSLETVNRLRDET
jgi:hypothetical protein